MNRTDEGAGLDALRLPPFRLLGNEYTELLSVFRELASELGTDPIPPVRITPRGAMNGLEPGRPAFAPVDSHEITEDDILEIVAMDEAPNWFHENAIEHLTHLPGWTEHLHTLKRTQRRAVAARCQPRIGGTPAARAIVERIATCVDSALLWLDCELAELESELHSFVRDGRLVAAALELDEQRWRDADQRFAVANRLFGIRHLAGREDVFHQVIEDIFGLRTKLFPLGNRGLRAVSVPIPSRLGRKGPTGGATNSLEVAPEAPQASLAALGESFVMGSTMPVPDFRRGLLIEDVHLPDCLDRVGGLTDDKLEDLRDFLLPAFLALEDVRWDIRKEYRTARLGARTTPYGSLNVGYLGLNLRLGRRRLRKKGGPRDGDFRGAKARKQSK